MEIIIPTQELNNTQCRILLDKLEDNNVDYYIDNFEDYSDCGENPEICVDSQKNADKVRDIIRDIKND